MKITIGYFDKTIFVGLLGYTFFIFLSDLVDQMNSNVDKLLLGRLSGTIAVALYSVGFNLKAHYTTVSWIVPELYVPETNRLAINEKNDNKLSEIFTKVGRFNNYLVMLVITGFILVGKPFITLWVGSEYQISYYAGVILMASGYIPAVQTLGVNIQNAKNMHKIRSIVYFGVACINVVSSIFLIKQWGVIGTCLGTLFATLIGHGIFMNYYYYKKVGLNIVRFWKSMIKWIIPVFILFMIAKIVLIYFPVNSWITLFAFAFVYSLVYLILLVMIELKPDERKKVIGKITKR